MPRIHINLEGKIFGRWTVGKRVENCNGKPQYSCQCSCGIIKKIRATSLRRNQSKSCGCLSGELTMKRMTKHGFSYIPEYPGWVKMIARCYNENDKSYHYYGGRDIIVCDRWKNSFVNFLTDMGHKPTSKHQIDRINNNGNYEPSNCRWATVQENTQHRSSSKLTPEKVLQIKLRFANEQRCIRGQEIVKKVAREYGIKTSTINGIRRGENWKNILLSL